MSIFWRRCEEMEGRTTTAALSATYPDEHHLLCRYTKASDGFPAFYSILNWFCGVLVVAAWQPKHVVGCGWRYSSVFLTRLACVWTRQEQTRPGRWLLNSSADVSRLFSSPLCSDEDATGGLRPEIRRTGGEEDQQLLHHGADVGGRHQRQGEIQRAAAETGQGAVRSVALHSLTQSDGCRPTLITHNKKSFDMFLFFIIPFECFATILF